MAPVHARLSERWSRPIAAALVARAHLVPGDRVLDVGTGGGIVAAQAARRVGGNGGHVVGVDVSETMLDQARAGRRGLPNVDFRRMPAEALDLPDGTFDAVLSLFALPHFQDPAAAVAEMRRVLRPGGRLVLGWGSRVPMASRAGVAHGLHRLRLVLASRAGRALIAPTFLEGLLRAEPGALLPPSPHVGRHAMVDRIRAAGFRGLETSWVGHEATIDSAEEFWELQAAFSTPARAWLAAASPERRRSLRRRFLEECARIQAAGGRLVYPQGALFVAARRAESGG